MDPPTPPVVGGAVVPDCVAGESTAEARPHSPSAYSAKTVFTLPRSPSVYPAETGSDNALPVAEVVLPVRPSSDRRCGGAPRGNGPRGTSLHLQQPQEVWPDQQEPPRAVWCHGTHVHFSRCPIPLPMPYF
jgi:hypothetical protein